MPRRRAFAALPLVVVLTTTRQSLGQEEGPDHTSAFPGDPECWLYSAYETRFDKVFTSVVRERPWLAQNILCAEGRGNWQSQAQPTLSFDRCCKNQTPSVDVERARAMRAAAGLEGTPGAGDQRRQAACTASEDVRAICCTAYVEELCWSREAPESREGFFSRCCSGQPSARAVAVDFPAGCRTRMWLEETAMKIVLGGRTRVPRLRPMGLGWAADVYLRTGEAVPSLRMLMLALARRNRDALDMCPEAALLAWLMQLEDGLHFKPLSRTSAKLRHLRNLWEALSRRLDRENGTETAWRRGRRGQVAALPDVIGGALARLEGQVRELGDLQRQRAGGRFRFDVVIAMCWPRDFMNVLGLLKDVLPHSNLAEDGTLYLYDICYGLFPGGSRAYDLRNRIEIEVHGPQAKANKVRELPSILRELVRRFWRAVVVPFHEEIGCGEVTVNMHHLDMHYDDLADVHVFVHTDVVEHVQFEALQRVMDSLSRRLWPQDLSFLYLGHRHNGPVDASGRVTSEVDSYCSPRHEHPPTEPTPANWSAFRGGSALRRSNFERQPSGNWCQWLELAWELIFGHPMRLPRDNYGGYDFGQFVVTREAVRRRPKAFWANAWQALSRRSNYELLLGTRFVSHRVDFATSPNSPAHHDTFHRGLGSVFEHIWHVFFFPDAKSWLWPTRFRDPTVPLSFKFEIHDRNPTMVKQYHWEQSGPL